MSRYTDWTHGAGVQVEYPERATYLRRTGKGTIVRQPAGSRNWFHFLINVRPTALVFLGPITQDVYIHANLNENARITNIDVWDGDHRIDGFETDLRGPELRYEYDMEDRLVRHGLDVCVAVEFLSGQPEGEVRFICVGAKFKVE